MVPKIANGKIEIAFYHGIVRFLSLRINELIDKKNSMAENTKLYNWKDINQIESLIKISWDLLRGLK